MQGSSDSISIAVWKDQLRKVYDNNLEQFRSYSETYGLHTRLGFASVEDAWQSNPLIQGSTDPADYKVVSKGQQVKAIKQAYSELAYLNLQDGFRDVVSRLFEMNLQGERQHRKGAPSGITHGLSINDAAKLFTVQHLLEGFANPDKWSVEDILSIRSEVLYAQAYAKRFHNELTAWADKWGHAEQIDYAKLMEVPS